MPSTLYGINSKNQLIELKSYQNSFASCYPAWDYFEEKYFGKKVSQINPECWKLNKKDMESPSEYFTLLSTFDGYVFDKQHLPEMISLLQEQSEFIPNLTRLQMLKDALEENGYNTFFITANSVSDYEEFIHYHCDDDDMVELSPPTVSDSVWDIWEAYLQE